MTIATVCILTAGIGSRMGHFAHIINKALLPLGKKAILSRIIERFPSETNFVIALGYKADQVCEYLEAAHPTIKFQYVSIEHYEGKGSGPAHSLSQCSELLQKPFFFVSCDTLWDDEIPFHSNENWFGTSKVIDSQTENYCNFEVDDNKIIKIFDKEKVSGDKFQSFIGLCYIRDYLDFWKSLKEAPLVH